MTRRGSTGLAGILLVDKPPRLSSHDVVLAVRRATGEGRIGHAGTLDPAATGLLVVLVGPFARLAPYLTDKPKTYEATLAFGTATDTDDADGESIASLPVPAEVLDVEFARSVLGTFLGPSEQMPPIYSAIKKDGRTAHHVARSGQQPVLERRSIEVMECELLGVDSGMSTWDVRFQVSKGTYIRALARDIGEACGTVAHLAALRRTASGGLRIEEAHSLDSVRDAAQRGEIETLFIDPLAALALPVVEGLAGPVSNGSRLPADAAPAASEGDLLAVAVGGELAALYRRHGDMLVPEVVLIGRQA